MDKITTRVTINKGARAYEILKRFADNPDAIRHKLLELIHLGAMVDQSVQVAGSIPLVGQANISARSALAPNNSPLQSDQSTKTVAKEKKKEKPKLPTGFLQNLENISL